jgi:putative ABC transport system ATP-binding protein
VTGPAIRARGLVAVRGGRRILDGVDLDVAVGERVAVTGASGTGKTTLLAILGGLERPEEGEIVVGADLRGRVALVLQGYGLVALLTAAENVELPLQAARHDRHHVLTEAAAALDAVGLADRADHLVDDLSGGEQQRVAVARALVGGPRLLLADEPTAELDATSRDRILDVLLARPATVVVVTHDAAVASRFDRRLVLANGRLSPV